MDWRRPLSRPAARPGRPRVLRAARLGISFFESRTLSGEKQLRKYITSPLRRLEPTAIAIKAGRSRRKHGLALDSRLNMQDDSDQLSGDRFVIRPSACPRDPAMMKVIVNIWDEPPEVLYHFIRPEYSIGFMRGDLQLRNDSHYRADQSPVGDPREGVARDGGACVQVGYLLCLTSSREPPPGWEDRARISIRDIHSLITRMKRWAENELQHSLILDHEPTARIEFGKVRYLDHDSPEYPKDIADQAHFTKDSKHSAQLEWRVLIRNPYQFSSDVDPDPSLAPNDPADQGETRLRLELGPLDDLASMEYPASGGTDQGASPC